jgi:hypothetical protein
MPEDIQERMRALIAQHGNALEPLVALQHTHKLSKMMSKLTL